MLKRYSQIPLEQGPEEANWMRPAGAHLLDPTDDGSRCRSQRAAVRCTRYDGRRRSSDTQHIEGTRHRRLSPDLFWADAAPVFARPRTCIVIALSMKWVDSLYSSGWSRICWYCISSAMEQLLFSPTLDLAATCSFTEF
eukprot:3300990-Pyramimonas_sp.AAC.1